VRCPPLPSLGPRLLTHRCHPSANLDGRQPFPWQAPSLGLDADFIDDLADAVVEVLPRIEETPISDIDEGRPVALRVVNDLVQLPTRHSKAQKGWMSWVRNGVGFAMTPPS
jgi:hypothetical protein